MSAQRAEKKIKVRRGRGCEGEISNKWVTVVEKKKTKRKESSRQSSWTQPLSQPQASQDGCDPGCGCGGYRAGQALAMGTLTKREIKAAMLQGPWALL